MSKIVVVTPTCRPESHAQFVKAWTPLFEKHKVTLITVWDGDDPSISQTDYGPHGEIGGKGYGELFSREPWSVHRDLFCRHTDACRNLGFVAAAQLNPTHVLTLDDDCYPCEFKRGYAVTGDSPDPIQAHLDALERRVPLSWMNTAHDTELYLRGVPYGVRSEAPVMLSHGVWVGTPDFDGETQLRLEESRVDRFYGGTGVVTTGGVPHSLPYYVGPIPRGVMFPLCFVPTAEVTMADGSRKRICDVKVGDRVFTRDGESHPVLRTMENQHDDDVVKVRVSGRDRELICTPNHNLWVLKPSHAMPNWVPASEITTDDMLATPIIKETIGATPPSMSVCKLIGYFLADGCYDKYSPFAPYNSSKYKGLSFCFGTEGKKDAIQDCRECLENLGVTYQVEHPKSSVTVVTTNTCYDLVNAFRDTYYLGEWSDGKRFPKGVFDWDVASKRAILAAYSAGDGCFSTIERVKGTTQYQYQAKTRSRTMANQIQLLMQSLGFPASVYRLSPYKQSKECWAVTINGTRAREYNTFLNGGPLPEMGKRRYDKSFCEGGFVYYPVKEVSRIKYEGSVFNLTVEDDHSYLVEGLIAKNCGMNVMVKRDALPYLYYAPMGKDSGVPNLHRFADIYCGIFLKREFDRLGWACVTGYSTIHHTRASDARKNFEAEKLGREWVEYLSPNYNRYSDIPMTPPDVLDTQFDDYFRSYADKRRRYQDLVTSILEKNTCPS